MLDEMQLPAKEFVSMLEEIIEYPRELYPVEQLDEDDIDAGDNVSFDEEIKLDWLETAHARSGVNCTACHVKQTADTAAGVWNDHPDHTYCESCHGTEVERFFEGKHGMRLQQGLSPMTPAQALLPMKKQVSHSELGCSSCHGAHRFDVQQAAVEACLGCHNDKHSVAYKESPHYSLWQKEINGDAEPGTGVSCASCHMPRISHDISEWSTRIIVDHNQSANFSPNTKMIRSSCQHCHGLEFSLDALADTTLVDSNYASTPEKHITTMDLAEKEDRRRKEAASEDDDADMFGF